jgi:hypothetical protein
MDLDWLANKQNNYNTNHQSYYIVKYIFEKPRICTLAQGNKGVGASFVFRKHVNDNF